MNRMDDLISRQAAIDLMRMALEDDWEPDYATDRINELPSVQSEPAIPLSWIEGQIRWLRNLDNAFSALTVEQISAMVNEWKDEQNG